MQGRRFLLLLGSLFALYVPSTHGGISFTWLDEPINMTRWPGPYSADLDLDANGFGFHSTNRKLGFRDRPTDRQCRLGLALSPARCWKSCHPTSSRTINRRNTLAGINMVGRRIAILSMEQHRQHWHLGSPNEAGYFGIRFTIDSGSHYGWVYLDNSWGAAGGGDILGWAYETTPYTSILAGAVPEPSTLVLLGIGSLVVLARIRRKYR